MTRLLCVVMWIFCLLTVSQAAPLPLGRGIGIHEWMNWSPLKKDKSYQWPPYRSVKEWLAGARPLSDWPPGNEFERIRSMGFDFIRLSVDPGPLLATKGAKRREALDVIAAAVRRITSQGLKVVLDLHSVDQVPAYSIEIIYGGADSEGVALYRQMVVSVAKMLVEIGTDKVAIEPFNEPAYYPCDASGTDDWQRIMSATVEDIRSVSSNLTIIVTGACGGSITGLTNLNPNFDDPNLYYNFHMYEPHSFTHQRAENPKNFSSGFPWPAKTGSREGVIANLKAHMRVAGLSKQQQERNLALIDGDIRRYFKEDWGLPQMRARIGEATAWAKANNIPVRRLFMGEFGVILLSEDGRMGAFNEDRLAYMSSLRKEAERNNIPWSTWEYSNPYGMTLIRPKGPAVPDMKLLRALGL
jgi:endoglucanase